MRNYNNESLTVEALLNKVLTNIEVNPERDVILFTTQSGEKYQMLHNQDCCEGVSIEDITGDLKDLIDTPILVAEERVDASKSTENDSWDDNSETWTFYEFRTVKGSVTIRWYGSSNGYYSESVDFEKISENKTL